MCHMGNNDRLTVVCYIALGCPSADGAGSGRVSTHKIHLFHLLLSAA